MTSWQVSESGATVALDAQGKGTVTVTVTNPGPDQDRAVLSITPLDGAAREWFTVEEPQRAIAGGDSAVYVVQVLVPPDTAEGSYAFQAIAYSAERDPSESSTMGRRVAFEVTPPKKSSFPWWIVAVVVVLLLVIGGVVFWLTRGDPPTNVELPTIEGAPTVLETLTATEGTWDNAEEFSFQWERCEPPADPPTETAAPEAEVELDCEPIEIGVGEEYQVGNDDVGAQLRVTVTASNGDGSAEAGSEPASVVPPLPPAVAQVPSVVGLRRSEAFAALSGSFQALALSATVEATVVCDPFVLSQAPAAGTTLEVGETVAFTVPPVSPFACPIVVGPLLELEEFRELEEFEFRLDLGDP